MKQTRKKMNRLTFLTSSRNVNLNFKKGRKIMNIPNNMGNIDESKPSPKAEYRPHSLKKLMMRRNSKHTLNPLDKDNLSILIGLLGNMEPEEVWINARTNVATELAA